MKTLRQFATGQIGIPSSTAWYLSDLGEFRGKQELYTRQSPLRLKALREHAMIESAVSSNRIEGVSIDPGRVRDIRSGGRKGNYPLVRVVERVIAAQIASMTFGAILV